MARLRTRRNFLGVSSAGAFALLAACSRQTSDSEVPILRVGTQRGDIRSLLVMAGEDKDFPYRVEWALFPAGPPMIEAMQAGAVDFGYVGSASMSFGLASSTNLKAIGAWRVGGKGNGILVAAESPIHSVVELKGKRIALLKGSAAHLLVAQSLENVGLSVNDVTIVNLLPADAKAALASNRVDAWSIWDPYMLISEEGDHSRPIITADAFGFGVQCAVATDQAIKRLRPQLLDIMTRVRRAYIWATAHPEESAKIFSKETGVPIEIARKLKTRTSIEVQTRISDDVIEMHQKSTDLYTKIGIIPRHIDISKAYDRSFPLPENT